MIAYLVQFVIYFIILICVGKVYSYMRTDAPPPLIAKVQSTMLIACVAAIPVIRTILVVLLVIAWFIPQSKLEEWKNMGRKN